MKRTILLVLCMMAVMAMNAGDVTPNEALQKATQFVNNRIAHGHGPRLAPGAQPRLTLASRVSGLYVYNVQNKGGFVIVSPDDETETILGYSDSGEFDESHMPDNMRYWLQGYAEEIAFVRGTRFEVRGTEDVRGTRFEVRGTEDVRGTRYEVRGTEDVRGTANAPMKAERVDVAPMLPTHWQQSDAFALDCNFDGNQCVTGCVATAMAQVMYYHQWPTETVNKIPAYTSSSVFDVAEIPAGSTIDWSNIQQEYGVWLPEGEVYGQNATYTDEQAKAVAHLLHCCGASVKMNYGTGASGASSTDISFALTHYFGYNETTQLVSRDSYTAEDWDEIIYHELSEGRPVLYGGATPSNEGHEFVCDGYNSTDGTYHINWGWQGVSNGYFVLSALDPDEQGIGGSSSNAGYNSNQNAIIGIQKPDATGDISPAVAQATGISLKLIDFSFSENPTILDNEVTLTFTVKNNSVNDYNDFLAIWESNAEGGSVMYYSITAGQTKTFTYFEKKKPEKTTQFNVLFYNANTGFMNTLSPTEELIVYPQNVSKTVGNYEWATFSSEYPLDFSGTGLEAYIVTGSNGNAIKKEAVTKVPANTGLVINGAAGDFTIPVTLAETDDVSSNKMVAVAEDITLEKGTDGNENFVLSVQEGNVVFARINADEATVRAGQAYLTLPKETSAPWLSIEGDEDTTGLDMTTVNRPQATDGIYYDLSGRRVEHPTKGLYIVNGKKVIIK